MIHEFDDFWLNLQSLELRRRGAVVKADKVVLKLLACLVERAGRLVTKEDLIAEVWEGRSVADTAITVSMARLRKLLGHRRGGPEFIDTSYGRGYRFVRAVTTRAAAEPSPSSEPPREGTGAPLVGRERALQKLRDALAQANAGRGRACLVLGEPGIGKTRLIEALEAEFAGPGVRVAWGYCHEAGDTPPLFPWLRVLHELERGLLSPSGEMDRYTVRDAAEHDLSPAATSGMDWQGPARHGAFEAVLRAIRRAGELTLCVIVIDDLHRADAASLELLHQLLDEIAHTRILVLATLRDSAGRRPARANTHLPLVLGHRNAERIVLERLLERDVATYVSALLDDPTGSHARNVFAHSEGNPFYMAELTRSLAEPERRERGGVPAAHGAALELVRQRVARLAPDVRELLSAAAAIGRTFELPVLAAATGREPSAVMLCLDDALDAEVVTAAAGSISAFAFGHALLRAVLYDDLQPQARRRWHARIADALERRADAGESIPPSEIAYHLYAALPDVDLRKTVDYCRAAAAAAAAVVASSDVARYARHALEALDLMERPSVRLRASLLYLIAIYTRSAAPNDCLRAAREAARLAREQQDGEMLLRASTVFNVAPGFLPLADAAPILEHALTLLSGQKALSAVAKAILANTPPNSFDAERCGELLDAAETEVRQEASRVAHYAVLTCKLYLQGGPRHERAASETVDALERLHLRYPKGTPLLPIDLSFQRAVTAAQGGELSSAPPALERALESARGLRHRELSWHTERMQALHRHNIGEFDAAEAALSDLHQRAETGAIWGTAPLCAFDRAVTLAELGVAQPLDAESRRALEYSSSDPPSFWALKVRALASAGLRDQARTSLRAVAIPDLAKLPCDRDHLGTLGQLARAALILGEADYGEALYSLLSEYSGRLAINTAFLCEGSVDQLLGMLASAAGREERACLHLESGLQHNRNAGLALRTLEAKLLLARSLQRHGSRATHMRALALGREAETVASSWGLKRWLDDAIGLQRQLSGFAHSEAL